MSRAPTDLTTLAQQLATKEGAAAVLDRYARVHNGDGGRDLRTARRLNSTIVRLDGVEIQVEYDTHGTYMSATDVDPEEFPVCIVKRMEIGGWDVTRLLESRVDEVASAVERSWGEE